MAKVDRQQHSGRAIRKGNAVTPKAQLTFGHPHTRTHTPSNSLADLTDRLKLIGQVLLGGPQGSTKSESFAATCGETIKNYSNCQRELDTHKVAGEKENQNVQTNVEEDEKCRRCQGTAQPSDKFPSTHSPTHTCAWKITAHQAENCL